MTLDQLIVGKSATIVSVGGAEALRNHLLDMGHSLVQFLLMKLHQ